MIKPIDNWLTLDEHGIQMPWYVRPFLEVLDKWDLKGKDVYEYGCGFSTLWYRSRGAIVSGVDSNEHWAKLADVTYKTDMNDYLIDVNLSLNYYDIIIIDGIWRDQCTKHALNNLKPGGKLIIDNWEQPSVEPNDWKETKELIKGLDIHVYKEPEHPDWKTAVITK